MSTQIETGQAYAPSAAQSSGRYLPWLIGGVVAAAAIAAILTLNANVGDETEAANVNTIGLTKPQQAQADRLAGAAVAADSAVGPVSRPAPTTAVVSGSVLIPGGSQHMKSLVDRLTRYEGQPSVTVSDFSPEAARAGITNPEVWTQSGVAASGSTVSEFSPEAARAGITNPELWTQSGGGASSSNGEGFRHEPR